MRQFKQWTLGVPWVTPPYFEDLKANRCAVAWSSSPLPNLSMASNQGVANCKGWLTHRAFPSRLNGQQAFSEWYFAKSRASESFVTLDDAEVQLLPPPVLGTCRCQVLMLFHASATFTFECGWESMKAANVSGP